MKLTNIRVSIIISSEMLPSIVGLNISSKTHQGI